MTDTDLTEQHLANERTFLAWINTSAGIMAFGFVVVKFSPFLKQFTPEIKHTIKVAVHEYSAAVGLSLVSVGALSILFSWLRYHHAEKQLRKGYYRHSTTFVNVFAAAIFAVSVALVAYLWTSAAST